jgi:phosphatidylglycerophosphate synthase
MRAAVRPALDGLGARLAARGVSPTTLTAAGWLVGVAACLAAATGHWTTALVLWLGTRTLDGLDGAVARVVGPTDRGGFLDIMADFSIYAGFVVGVAIAEPDARLACVVLLATYYASGTAFLALSSLLERRRHRHGDDRSLRFVGGLAEGTETIVVYVLFTLVPQHAEVIAWTFAAVVALTAVQRLAFAARALSDPRPGAEHDRVRTEPAPTTSD